MVSRADRPQEEGKDFIQQSRTDETDNESSKTNLKEFKKLVRQRQRDAWRTFCEEIEDYTQVMQNPRQR